MSNAVEIDIESKVRHVSSSRKTMSSETRLFHDLYIGGDDAADLLDSIANEYQVNLSGFEFDKYFPNESEALIYSWGLKFGIWRRRFKPFSLGHLVAIAKSGKWFEQV